MPVSLHSQNKSQLQYIIKQNQARQMGDWIMQLFQPDYNPIDQQFLSKRVLVNAKLQQALFPQQIRFQDQTPLRAKQLILQRNYESTPANIEENTQQAKNQECVISKPKRKKMPSKLNEAMGFVSEFMIREKCKKIKKKTAQNACKPHSQYPTKNFLQNFKIGHLDFLQTKISLAELLKNELFCSLKMKSGMAMEDYKQLYSVDEFRPAFEQMFRTKYLYRSMMLSRSGARARINHIKKLFVFEQSFRTRSFNKIN